MSYSVNRLVDYFSGCVDVDVFGESVGMEVETHFVDKMERPITVDRSQSLFRRLTERFNWRIINNKGGLITEIRDKDGNKILYELGRQNIEVATAVKSTARVVSAARKILEELYLVGETLDVYPCFWPVLETEEDLLIIPDERDAVWLELDGRFALELLARCAAVQFTIAVSPREATRCLKRLARSVGLFLEDYPQEIMWKHYIKESKASYDPLRYGGPLFFQDPEDYCRRLTEHRIVVGSRLVPHQECTNLDISLFLRSVWWYFRLKKYGDQLCVEVRPLTRRSDDKLQEQLEMTLDIMA